MRHNECRAGISRWLFFLYLIIPPHSPLLLLPLCLPLLQHLRSLASGGYGFSLDTSGNPHVLRNAVDVLNPLGIAGLIGGAAPGVEVKIDMLGLLPGKQLRGIIQGDSVSSVFLPQLIAHHAAGRFPFEKMITFYDGLGELNRAIDDVKNPQGTVIKPVIRIAPQQ